MISRLIPAWAGKTLASGRGRKAPEAHPRVGGENSVEKIDKGVRQWLIPAWAGKTRPPLSRSRRARAHPRVGGENLIGVAADLSAQGSSPRGRGKRILDTTCVASRGLIPAWAGKTDDRYIPLIKARAHPRVGGENRVTS